MKSLTLVLSAGRSGTNKLATLMSTVPNVFAEHEGDPGFHLARIQNLHNPIIGYKFVEERLKFFRQQNKDHVVHTGHMVNEGFIEHFLAHDIIPNVIVLRRPQRDIARSMFNLQWIPGKNKIIEPWYSSPNEPNVVPFDNWQQAHPYQLCYWWCLESERRTQYYMSMLQSCGSCIRETTLEKIVELDSFNALLDFFNLEKVATISREKVNHFEAIGNISKKQNIPDSYLEQLEQDVLTRIPAEFKYTALCG